MEKEALNLIRGYHGRVNKPVVAVKLAESISPLVNRGGLVVRTGKLTSQRKETPGLAPYGTKPKRPRRGAGLVARHD